VCHIETLKAISTRTSIRRFLNKEIPMEIIKNIVEAGTLAPSGGNRQPWRFIVVTDKQKIKKFDPYYSQKCVKDAPAIIVACVNPHDTWEKYDEDDNCYILDTAAAIQNMLLSIHAQGLGGVWVVSFSKQAVRKELDIPLHWDIVSIVPFGYYDGINNKTPRKDISEVAFLNNLKNPIYRK